ncbi:hypothetical protein AVEN_146599-1 [Araneus ventricosus]|uniref:SHSP domain-containing protein n=1 Tax=Araneus ventricosus TaxID=182803 RepID=A0A4Y2KYL2_ARAVE|nr:hypothetical protein AVEN_146599-1 [Araneus ventricosus]
MNRFDGVEEKEIYEILDRMTSKNDFWAMAKPFPEKIGFQRFGLQLREEDFEQDGVSYRGFFLRDRNEVRKATSGFSVVKNDEKEFKVVLDVWPFKRDELSVMVVPGKYFTIKGEHEETFEDNSDCTRKFQRYYCLPRGSDTMECSYCNGTLTITVEKREVSDETRGPQTVPINLVTCSEVLPIEEQHPPTEIRDVPTASDDLQNDDEPVAKATESPKEAPVTKRDLRKDFLPLASKNLKGTLATLVDMVHLSIMLVMESSTDPTSSGKDQKSDKEVVAEATEPLKETIMAYVDMMTSLREETRTRIHSESYNAVVEKIFATFNVTIDTVAHMLDKTSTNARKLAGKVLSANKDAAAEDMENLRARLFGEVYLINSTVMNDIVSAREQLFAVEDSKSDNEEEVQGATGSSEKGTLAYDNSNVDTKNDDKKALTSDDGK